MTLSIKPESSYYYNKGEWKIMLESQKNLDFTTIEIACYNVLFYSNSYIKKKITDDENRTLYQINTLFPKINTDIIGLSEVTRQYIDSLLDNKYIQDNYIISSPFKKGGYFRNLILSRYPILFYSMDNLIFGRIMIGLIKMEIMNPKKSLIIISVHLIAYETYYLKRKRQLSQIIEGLSLYNNPNDENFIYFKSALNENNVIIMGDLNFHLKIESNYIIDNNLIDLWTENNHLEPGYTWDSLNNPLIKLMIPFDNRRMRLDRIMLMNNSKLIKLNNKEKMEIFGNEKIFKNKCCSYLMGSDHFGIKIKLEIHDGIHGNDFYERKNYFYLDENDPLMYKTGFRTQFQTNIIRGLVFFFVIVMIIIIIIFSINF